MRSPRGLTLIELVIALGIASLLFGAIVVGLGAVTGARARAAAGQLSATIRALYDVSALTGRTCRLVFQLGEAGAPVTEESPRGYRAECAEGAAAVGRTRDEPDPDDDEPREEPSGPTIDRGALSGMLGGLGGLAAQGPGLSEVMEAEEARISQASRFQGFVAEGVDPVELPSAVGLSVWTRARGEQVTRGLAYLYFFPDGHTERAQIAIRQGSDTWTLDVAALTGKVTIVAEALEPPDA